jgi:hypothetical protein
MSTFMHLITFVHIVIHLRDIFGLHLKRVK